VRTGPARAVPNHLRDRHRPGAETYGPYLYPHASPGAWVEQRYLPEGLDRGAFFSASERGWEAERAEALDTLRGEYGRIGEQPSEDSSHEAE
jgi:putative ATPase